MDNGPRRERGPVHLPEPTAARPLHVRRGGRPNKAMNLTAREPEGIFRTADGHDHLVLADLRGQCREDR